LIERVRSPLLNLMALQSQTLRSSSGPRSSSALKGRSGPAKRLIGIMLLVGVVGGGLILLTRQRDGAAMSGGGSPQVASANPAAQTTRPGPGPSSDPMVATTAGLRTPAMPASSQTAPSQASPAQSLPKQSEAAPAGQPARDPLPGVAPVPAGDGGLSPDTLALTTAAERASAEGRLVEARAMLNKALSSAATPAQDRAALRAWIARLNQDLVFSPKLFAGDTIGGKYTVVRGDSLVVITRKEGTVAEPSLIARVNRMSNPNALSVGQTLKVVRGPFHAVVSKAAFRMDVYAGPTPSDTALNTSGLPDGMEPGWTYITSFPVGLGEKSGTPIASFMVKASKLINPTWVNPRTGKRYAADDPENPIGERWIGLQGHDEGSKAFQGYGVHGTIEPESIGSERSMGCVRMRAEDVEVVYELLMPRVSVVKIVP